MKRIKNFLKTTVTIWGCLALASLLGCTSQPAISEANTYLQVQGEMVQLNTYKAQVKAAKERLTQVVPQLQNPNPELPPSNLVSLTTFLLENDCTKQQLTAVEKERCYRVTRLLLINTTRALDDANMKAYAGQRTVSQLITNINVLIDGLDEQK